jgi:hypothetical protein
MNPVLSIPRSCPSAAGERLFGLTRRLLVWLLLAAGAPGLTTLQLRAQEDNFNDNLDNGWSRYNPIGVASFSLLNGAYRIRTAPSPDPAIFGPGRAGSLLLGTNYGDFFYVSIDLVNWDDTLRQSVGLLARIGSPGAGQTTGYAFTWDRGNASATSGDVDISRIDGEVPTGVAPNVNDLVHLQPGKQYRLVFIGKGPALEGRVYQLPDTTTPLVTLIGSDSMYASGQVGLVTFANTGTGSTDGTFDNFLATDVEPPRIRVEQLFPDLFQFSWPAVPVEYSLQASSKLPAGAGDWQDLVDVRRVDENDVFDLETGPNRTVTPPLFFRLKRKP